MPRYNVEYRISNWDGKPCQPGQCITASEEDAAPLVRCGALSLRDGESESDAPKAASQPGAPGGKGTSADADADERAEALRDYLAGRIAAGSDKPKVGEVKQDAGLKVSGDEITAAWNALHDGDDA